MMRNTGCPSIQKWLVLVLSTIAAVYSYLYIVNPGCPTVSPQPFFNIKKFQGTWYQMFASSNAQGQNMGKFHQCVMAEFEPS